MAALPVPLIAVRGSTGISMQYGPPTYDLATSCPRDLSKQCKAMTFSPNGQYFAYSNGTVVKVFATKDWKEVCQLERPKVSYLKFSPKGTFLMTWEPFFTSPSNPQGSPNMNVYKTETGEEIKGYVFKKHTGWELQWSDDEKLCARNSGNDVFFYENLDLDKVANRLGFRAESFSLSPGSKPHHVICYVPAKQGPSSGRLFQYPKFGQTDAVANKSFFQAERLDSFWNQKGTGVLLMTNVDVDASGASYYGKQSLHYLTTKGDTSMVTLGKEGPIYSIAWSPLSTEFCVVYGFMPAKATLYNIKCEAVFDFGTGPRNLVFYNPFGNLMMLAGFGNLRGALEVWEAPQRKQVATLNAPDSTWLGWCPDGEHFATATTAPRLRQGNGFKVWHYSGSLLFERPWNKEEELLEVQWQTFPAGTFKVKPVVYRKVEGIQPSQPEASKEVYRPPQAKGQSTFKIHEIEPARYIRPGGALPPGFTDTSSATKAGQKKKKKKSNKPKEGGGEAEGASEAGATSTTTTTAASAPPKSTGNINWLPSGITENDLVTDDPEMNKKIKNIKKKLEAIQKLKEQAAAGKQLELNQKEKITKENEVIAELRALVL